MNRLDRLHGCLAGLALGDALGMPTEMLSPEEIVSEFGWLESFREPPAWHPHHGLAAGRITDDTGQALAVAHAYAPDGSLTAAQVAQALLDWAEACGDDLERIAGPSTLRALERLRAGESPALSGKNGTTNGAAYRAVPVGLASGGRGGRLQAQLVEVCLPTHGTRVAIAGAGAVGFAIARALEPDADLEAILGAAGEGARWGAAQGAWAWGTPLDGRIELALRLVEENPEPGPALAALYRYVGTDLLVAESVAAAFGLVALSRGDPMRAVVYAANLGGDTDTIGALAGAVCGAYRGIAAFDASMLEELERVNRLDLAAAAARLESLIP